MKYRVLSIDAFHDSDAVQFHAKGRCFELEEAIKICKEWKEEKGLNGMVRHYECIEPVEDAEAKKFNEELDAHEQYLQDILKS